MDFYINIINKFDKLNNCILKSQNNKNYKGVFVMKKYIITLAFTSLALAVTLSAPKYFINSIPTAENISVKKTLYTASIVLDGNIKKDFLSDKMIVTASVSEKDINKICLDMQAEISGDAFPDTIYNAKVTDISETATTKKVGVNVGTYVDIKLEIENPDDNLRTGYSATATLFTAKPKNMNILPYEAFGQDEFGEYVYILEDNTAVKCYVKTGEELPEGLEIVAGLSSDAIILDLDDNEYVNGEKIIIK